MDINDDERFRCTLRSKLYNESLKRPVQEDLFSDDSPPIEIVRCKSIEEFLQLLEDRNNRVR